MTYLFKMNRRTPGRLAFEEELDYGDGEAISENSRLVLDDDEDDRLILIDPGTSAEMPNIAHRAGHGDELSVDSIQVYHDENSSADFGPPSTEFHPQRVVDHVARNQLIAVSVFCSLFIVGEIVGGVLSNSVAILTDAVHLASDLVSFIISLIALYVAVRKPSATYTFGLYRAEVIGATVSILTIWLVTGVLGYLAVKRIIDRDFEIESDDMVITAACCVGFNVIMALVLNVRAFNCRLPHSSFGHSHGNHSHGNHSHLSNSRHDDLASRPSSHSKHTNINVKAAFIHVIGDLIQSVGILIASLIIKFRPDWKLADPICTLLFAVLVLFTTIYMLRDIFSVILEATPRTISYSQVQKDLMNLAGVKLVPALHLWSLTLHKTVCMATLAVSLGVDYDAILAKATTLLKSKYNFSFVTVQVEAYRPEMTSRYTNGSELEHSASI